MKQLKRVMSSQEVRIAVATVVAGLLIAAARELRKWARSS